MFGAIFELLSFGTEDLKKAWSCPQRRGNISASYSNVPDLILSMPDIYRSFDKITLVYCCEGH